MTITKAEPEISELSQEQVIAIEEGCEYHEVPFGSMRVDAFHEDALIREAVAQYWAPEYSLETADGGRRDSELSQLMWDVFPQGLLQCYDRPETSYAFPVEVRIVLTYPLSDYWEARVKIPANRIGEVFAIAYDIYRHIYDLDSAEWQSAGHQDAAPRGGGGLLNRAAGKYVWGHDMSDLIFESVGFLVNPDWSKSSRRKPQIIDCTGDDAASALEKVEESIAQGRPDPVEVLAPLSTEEHGNSCPFLGTFIFGIGS